jgi:hypothetical protein
MGHDCTTHQELKFASITTDRSTARFWGVEGMPFYIVAILGSPIPLPGAGGAYIAITTCKRRWQIFGHGAEPTAHLRACGLDPAIFSTRREALEHLGASLEGANAVFGR